MDEFGLEPNVLPVTPPWDTDKALLLEKASSLEQTDQPVDLAALEVAARILYALRVEQEETGATVRRSARWFLHLAEAVRSDNRNDNRNSDSYNPHDLLIEALELLERCRVTDPNEREIVLNEG